MKHTRLQPDDRKQRILDAAMNLATSNGYNSLTRDGVAAAAGVSAGLVTRYFYATAYLKQTVMENAVDREILSIIFEGLAVRDPVALAAPAHVRAAAIASMTI